LKTDNSKTFDLILLVATVILLGLGLIMVYSASSVIAEKRFGHSGFFLLKQLIRMALALVLFFIAIKLDYHIYFKMAFPIFTFGIFLLLVLLLSPGVSEVYGAKRWLSIPGIPLMFQPSDFARLAMIFYLGKLLVKKEPLLEDFQQGFMPILTVLAITCCLVALEPDLSTAMLFALIGMSMLYCSGIRKRHVFGILGIIIPIALAVIWAAPYRRARLMAFLSAGTIGQEASYQVQQSVLGLGSGGLWGKGLGYGGQKFFFLPEPFTDFVFAILGEELGFIGALFTMVLFVVLIWRGFKIAEKAPDAFGTYLAIGITMSLAWYGFFHIGVNSGLLPPTGIPLPFISYGGTSLLISLMGVGILINISSQLRSPVHD